MEERRKACTFFGHADAPIEARHMLEGVVRNLIENEDVCVFYIGLQGSFDIGANLLLDRLKGEYPHIEHFRVLSYLPTKKNEYETYDDTLLPDGIESVPPKFAILYRNQWMIDHSDYVVTYVTHSWGGAAKAKALAEKKKKIVMNLSDLI